MTWKNDWPVIGIDKDGDGKGEPILTYSKPDVGSHPIATPLDSDEFNSTDLGLQWQWQANPKATWAFLNAGNGTLRLYSQMPLEANNNLWNTPNVLMQKFPAEEFVVTTKLKFAPNLKLKNEQTGLVIMGLSYASIYLKSSQDGADVVMATCKDAYKGSTENEVVFAKAKSPEVYFRVIVRQGAKCSFSYSFDGKKFVDTQSTFQAEPGKWIGAKVGIFCTRNEQTNDAGYADFDWFKVESIQQ